MAKNTKMESRNIRLMLQSFRYIYDCDTFKIHRDFIADYFGITVASVAQYMGGLFKKGVISLKATSADKLYTVILIRSDGYILKEMEHKTKEDLDKLTNEWLEKYKESHQQTYYDKDTNIKYDTLDDFLEAKRQEQIDRKNPVELKLIAVFDELGINYDYQHKQTIMNSEGKMQGYIYDFLVGIGGKKYDVEVDGSSHDGREEHDKIRDELSRSIGIEPRRFPTQMVYLIEYEVRRGLLGKSDLLELIENDYSSIKELWDSVKHWYKKSNESESKAKELNKVIENKLKEVLERVNEVTNKNAERANEALEIGKEATNKLIGIANKSIEIANEKAEKIKKLEEIINERNETIKTLEAQIKNKDEILDKITNLVHYNVKYDREKEIRDEMARECFSLSSKKQEEQLNDDDEQCPF